MRKIGLAIGVLCVFLTLVGNVANAARLERLTLRGEWRSGYCYYQGSVNTGTTFPDYEIYFPRLENGQQFLDHVTGSITNSVEIQSGGSYAMQFQFLYRIVTPSCVDKEVAIYLR